MSDTLKAAIRDGKAMKAAKRKQASDQALLSDLARAKVLFQQRAIVAAMGIHPDEAKGGK